jgi:TPR repeat protein
MEHQTTIKKPLSGIPKLQLRYISHLNQIVDMRKENAGGCFGLGEIYESGWGRPIDLEQAKHWYSKAATLGDGDANMSLGR